MYDKIYQVFLRFVKENIGDGNIPIYIKYLIDVNILKKLNYKSWLNNSFLIWEKTNIPILKWYEINYSWISLLLLIDNNNNVIYQTYKDYYLYKISQRGIRRYI